MNTRKCTVRHPLAFLPLKVCILYLSGTLAIAFWGPIDYYQFPKSKTAIFMIFAMISICLGYWVGAHAKISEHTRASEGSYAFFSRLFMVSLVISITTLAASVVQAALSGTLNTDISSMGNAYLSGYEYLGDRGRNSGSYSLSFIISSFVYPFSFITFVMGFFYWGKLSGTQKLLFIAYIALYTLFYVVGSGKMKYIGDLLIYVIAVVAVRYARRGRPMGPRMIISGLATFIVGGLALLAVLGQRYAALGFSASNANIRANQLMHFDLQHPLFEILGERLGLNLSLLMSYVSQGYYGLGLALETDWKWTKFQGFSYSVSVLCNRILGQEWAWPHTLVYRVGDQWGWGDTKWHTVFPHFATDFTFPGTVVLFGFFSYVFSKTWIKVITFENPAALLLFTMLLIGMFFIPANNQLLQTPGSLFLALTVAFLYLRFGNHMNEPFAGTSLVSGSETRKTECLA
jgi:hypothetical protein